MSYFIVLKSFSIRGSIWPERGGNITGISIWHNQSRFHVYTSNYAKFTQNERLKEFLLATNNKTIVEDNPHDKTWGIGLRYGETGFDNRNLWQGKNWLGEALIKIREDIKQQIIS